MKKRERERYKYLQYCRTVIFSMSIQHWKLLDTLYNICVLWVDTCFFFTFSYKYIYISIFIYCMNFNQIFSCSGCKLDRWFYLRDIKNIKSPKQEALWSSDQWIVIFPANRNRNQFRRANFCTNRNRNSSWILKLGNKNRNNICQMGSICKLFTNRRNTIFLNFCSKNLLLSTLIYFFVGKTYRANKAIVR